MHVREYFAFQLQLRQLTKLS